METNTNPVELSLAENVAILAAGNFLMGYRTGNVIRGEVGIAQFEIAMTVLGAEGLAALGKKLDAHANSLGGTESFLAGTDPLPTPTAPEPTTSVERETVTDERPIFLNEKEALLLGAGLNVASAVGTNAPAMAVAAMEVYVETALALGMSGQKALEAKLNESFDLFVPQEG